MQTDNLCMDCHNRHIKQLREKEAENARLRERLAQAEGLLRSKADRLHIPCGNHWLPDPDVAAFLHPEKEKNT